MPIMKMVLISQCYEWAKSCQKSFENYKEDGGGTGEARERGTVPVSQMPR